VTIESIEQYYKVCEELKHLNKFVNLKRIKQLGNAIYNYEETVLNKEKTIKIKMNKKKKMCINKS
jgi:hypothetical protein